MERGSGSTAGRRALVALVVACAFMGVGDAFSAGSALAGGKAPLAPSCTALPVSAITRLLGVGKLYRDSVMAKRDGSQCTYYGVPRSAALPSAPASEIHYYASLHIATVRTPEVFYFYQEDVLDAGAGQQGLSAGGVDPTLKIGTEGREYHGVISSLGLPRCEAGIEYDNWVGPPQCWKQPALKKIGVLAYRGSSTGMGLMVEVVAAAQFPSALSQRHVELLAKGVFEGRVPKGPFEGRVP